jgi:UrcA family protein
MTTVAKQPGENVMQSFSRKSRTLVTMIALAATAGIASTAQAQAQAAHPAQASYDDVVVTYSDLNLDSAAGLKVLYARLEAAAERACGNEPASHSLQRKAQFRACVDSALNRAIDKVGGDRLQALHQSDAASDVG